MPKTMKTVIFWFVIFVSALLLWQVVRAAPENRGSQELSYSGFLSAVDAGNVWNVTIAGQHIRGWYIGGKGAFHVIGPSNPGIYLDLLRSKNVEVWFRDTGGDSLPLQVLGTWAPLILLAALWFFMIRQMRRRKSLPAAEPGAGSIEPK